MEASQTIALYQPTLQAIALKMLGCMADAEDMVQDTFLKWLSVDHDSIENNKSYLVKAVTNNCINHLNTLKKKKDECLENLSAVELFAKYKDTDFAKFDLENELSEAWQHLQKRLEPVEKAVFVLREIFDYEYEELQHIVDKKKDNCRQIFSRSKEKLSIKSKKLKTDLSQQSRLLESFKFSCAMGHPSEFIADIKKEISSKKLF